MSSALAIAAVTATLKDLLNEGLLNHDLSSIGSFSVTAQPPDRITTGNTEANQINVFLYQVTPNLGWRNVGLPSRDGRGNRIANAPLALDLHYLISAYGAQDLNAEILLGYAMQLLHETPGVSREQLRIVLGVPSPVDDTFVPGRFGTMSAADLADQVELIKIAPVYLGADDLSKLWTAMQARYRPSMAYLVSVVLIQAEGGARVAPPVLKRGPDDRGPQALASAPPVLQAVRNAANAQLPASRLGDALSFVGNGLAQPGTLTAVFTNERLDIVGELPLSPGATSSELRARLPDASVVGAKSAWAAGVHGVAIRIDESGKPSRSTNGVPIAVSPRITAAPLTSASGTPFTLTVTCVPRLRALQEPGVRLIFGQAELLPTAIDTPADPETPTSIQFAVPALAAGSYPLRLRVDGIDSLPIVVTGSPPVFGFDDNQTVTLT